MKKTKLFISFLAFAPFTVGMLPLVSCGGDNPIPPEPQPTPSTSFSWELNTGARTATIKQFIGNETEIIIPKEYKAPDGLTYSVTKIDSLAFSFFGCDKITSIKMPDSIKEIGVSAFKDCSGLTSAVISTNITNITDNLFSGCIKLSSVIIPAGVTNIGNNAFYECSALTSIIIPDSVMSINDGAFYGCTGLQSATIGLNVASIGKAFYGCTNLKEIIFSNGGLCVGSSSSSFLKAHFKDSPIEKISILKGGIGDLAFLSCDGLKSVTFGPEVTSIGIGTFEKCTNLSSIIISDGVETIWSSAFSQCTGLTSVTIGANVNKIGESAFYLCKGFTTIKYNSTHSNWLSINKEADWNRDCSATSVECTDGTYPIGS